MHISGKAINPRISQEIENHFILVLTDLKNKDEAASFFHDFLTPSEQVVLMKRLAIAVLLHTGKSYEVIKDQLKVSSATISFVSEQLKKPGFKAALQKIKEDEWAEGVISSFAKLLKKKNK
jgi:TrpR-related protein YerC/YecD